MRKLIYKMWLKTANVGGKHQSINQPIILPFHFIKFLLICTYDLIVLYTNMFDLILSWGRTTHVLVSYHGLSTLCTTETNVIGQTVQICLI